MKNLVIGMNKHNLIQIIEEPDESDLDALKQKWFCVEADGEILGRGKKYMDKERLVEAYKLSLEYLVRWES